MFWWRDVIKESTIQKVHTPVVELGLRWMALFIASEVMFFVAFLAFFDASLTPKLPIEEHMKHLIRMVLLVFGLQKVLKHLTPMFLF